MKFLHPLILTLRPDPASQTFFNNQRERYFPPERNLLKAHLTLFHQLPNDAATRLYLKQISRQPFEMAVDGLINLGGGVAYHLQSAELKALYQQLSLHFKDILIPQDRQLLRAHITVQNKVTPAQARALLAELQQSFQPFRVTAVGLDLWTYLGGPWQHEAFYEFV